MKSFTLWSQKIDKEGQSYGSSCLSVPRKAFYHGDYHTAAEGTDDVLSDYILRLKNDNGCESPETLEVVKREVVDIFKRDLPQIPELIGYQRDKFTVCLVPRAKASYPPEKLVLRAALKEALQALQVFEDGVDFIVRVKDTKTTHIHAQFDDAPAPYKGITKETCNISSELKDKNVILVDDVYTRNKDIDEDAIQALLDLGAKTVVLYVLGKTAKREN